MYRTMKYWFPTFGSILLNPPMMMRVRAEDVAVAEELPAAAAAVASECPTPAPPPAPEKPKCKKVAKTCKEDKRTELEKCLDSCRKECVPISNAFINYTKEMSAMVKSVTGTVADNVEYLQKCADPEVQYGAVATGGIIGMLFGIRKSFVRRIFYGAIGAGAMFSVVFPEDAARISREGYDLAMKYGKEGYDYFAGNRCPVECPKRDCPKKECRKAKECKKRKPAEQDCAPGSSPSECKCRHSAL